MLLSIAFYAYHNCNWFPERERCQFTIKIYYESGRIVNKKFDLPKSTKFALLSMGSRSSLLSIYYSNKPFGSEYGYLAFGVEDFEIVNKK